ncbi:UNVERIFIED_CONTAM: hypothetical protein NCL1_13442 [Trichonephila clavipes]
MRSKRGLCCSNTCAVSTVFVVIHVIVSEIKWNQRSPYHALAQLAATAVPDKQNAPPVKLFAHVAEANHANQNVHV